MAEKTMREKRESKSRIRAKVKDDRKKGRAARHLNRLGRLKARGKGDMVKNPDRYGETG